MLVWVSRDVAVRILTDLSSGRNNLRTRLARCDMAPYWSWRDVVWTDLGDSGLFLVRRRHLEGSDFVRRVGARNLIDSELWHERQRIAESHCQSRKRSIYCDQKAMHCPSEISNNLLRGSVQHPDPDPLVLKLLFKLRTAMSKQRRLRLGRRHH